MLGDLGAAIGIAFTYFTIIYLTGLGGLFSERSGIVNIGLEGMMIIGTVTGSWGTFFFTTRITWGGGCRGARSWGILIGLDRAGRCSPRSTRSRRSPSRSTRSCRAS